jgi:Carbohydrate esterase, sialic acid-specific acetylesterase
MKRGTVGVLLVALLTGLAAAAAWRAWRGAEEFRRPLAAAALPQPQQQALDCGQLVGAGQRQMVVLVLGQSNAANHVQSRSAGGPGVYTWYEGRCFEAVDPLPGASGDGGSLWTRLGPLIVASAAYDAVLFVPVAVNATTVAQWLHHPELSERLRRTLLALREAKLEPSHAIWYQGEADSFKQTSAADYRSDFVQVLQNLRGLGLKAPLWVAQATLCQMRSNPAVRALQQALPQELSAVRAGPDMDALFGPQHRYDGCHFGTDSAKLAAQAWQQALFAPAPSKPTAVP